MLDCAELIPGQPAALSHEILVALNLRMWITGKNEIQLLLSAWAI